MDDLQGTVLNSLAHFLDDYLKSSSSGDVSIIILRKPYYLEVGFLDLRQSRRWIHSVKEYRDIRCFRKLGEVLVDDGVLRFLSNGGRRDFVYDLSNEGVFEMVGRRCLRYQRIVNIVVKLVFDRE